MYEELEVSKDLSRILSKISVIASNIREKYYESIEQFYMEGYSEHDCVEINGELAGQLLRHGIKAELVPVTHLLDYATKHYAVRVDLGRKKLIVDIVPELTGLIPQDDILYEPLILTEEQYVAFFEIYYIKLLI